MVEKVIRFLDMLYGSLRQLILAIVGVVLADA
jgi:hypothetical protein